MNSNVTKEKRAKILNQVRVLLDIADRETTPPGEAESARAKAEQFMRDYRIEEEQALAVDPNSLKAEMRLIQLAPRGSEFVQEYLSLFASIVRHVGVRARFTWVGGYLTAQTVGYAFDLDAAELLFTSARMVFAEHLEPGKDESLSEADNVYRLRRAGLERWRVAQIMWDSNTKDGAAHGKVAKIYKAEAERRGEVPALAGRGVSAEIYRSNYAKGFTNQLDRRLRDAREGADKIGGLPALFGRQERVDEAFYALFPEYRPSTEVATREEPGPCNACKKTKHASGRCRDHRVATWTRADEARYVRQYESPSALAGAGAGRTAANAVSLDGSTPTKRLDDRTDDERETTRVIKGLLGN